jgi:hypothetical protein
VPPRHAVAAAADQPCCHRRQRLPSRGLTMVSLMICRRFDLLSAHTQFDLRPSLFARRRRRRQWPYLLSSSLCLPGQQTQGVVRACAPAMAGRRHQEEHVHQHLNAVVVATCHLDHELAGAFILPTLPTTPLSLLAIWYQAHSWKLRRTVAMERKLISHVYTQKQRNRPSTMHARMTSW